MGLRQAQASVAELVYAADLKSAPTQWDAGSTPAARTTCIRLKIPLVSIHSDKSFFFSQNPRAPAFGFLFGINYPLRQGTLPIR